MSRYTKQVIDKVQLLRSEGKTYGEIQKILGVQIPKSTLSWICRRVILPKEYATRISYLNNEQLAKGRKIALEINKIRRNKFLQIIQTRNISVAKKVNLHDTGKIALAMLCLGEASKYNPQGHRSFSLGNTDPRIIRIFLGLLQQCFVFDIEKVRATVQCRADQDTKELEVYWQKITGIPSRLFYKPLIDPRTKGKPTKKLNYRGVLRIDYFDSKIQQELECLADLIYNQIRLKFNEGPVA